MNIVSKRKYRKLKKCHKKFSKMASVYIKIENNENYEKKFK